MTVQLNTTALFGQTLGSDLFMSLEVLYRRSVAFGFRLGDQSYCCFGTCGNTKAASDTPATQDSSAFPDRDRIHLAALDADPASCATITIDMGKVVRGHMRGRLRKPFEILQNLATTATARADIDDLLRVGRLEHQPTLFGLVQDAQSLLLINGTPKTIF